MTRKRGSNGSGMNWRSGKARKPASSMFAMALEPRFMFDAAGFATATDPHVQPDQPSPASQSNSADSADSGVSEKPAAPQATQAVAADMAARVDSAVLPAVQAQSQDKVRSMVFVDTSVVDYQTLIKNIAPDAKVVLLNSQEEALGQMAKALSGMSGLDSIQVISHGGEGHLYMAGRVYWTSGLVNRAADLQAIGAALRPGGDILFYACNVGAGEDGRAFVDTVHALTGADVAASSDGTGSKPGENWNLEVRSGNIEAAAPFARASMAAFTGHLATITVNDTSDSTTLNTSDGKITFREAISAVNGTASADVGTVAGDGSDIIVFSSSLKNQSIKLSGNTTSVGLTITKGVTINGDVDGDSISDVTLTGDINSAAASTSNARGIVFGTAGQTLKLYNMKFQYFFGGSGVANGVIDADNGTVEIVGSTFSYNSQVVLNGNNTTFTVRNSIVTDNVGTVSGVSFFPTLRFSGSTVVVENTVIANNSITTGVTNSNNGGVVLFTGTAAGSGYLRNVTIANNSVVSTGSGAVQTGSVMIGAGVGTGVLSVSVYNSILADNKITNNAAGDTPSNNPSGGSATLTASGTNNWIGATNGTTAAFNDVANRDYRPAAGATSFINAGNSSSASYYASTGYDIRGIDRIRDGALDLGAYEVQWGIGTPDVDLNGAGSGKNESVSTSSPNSGVLIAPSATLSQTDTDTRLLGATITLSGISDTGNESLTLSASDVNTAKGYGIAVLNNNSATITLRGAASVADYQSVIRLIQYKNTAGSYTVGTRTATITVNDGETTSSAQTSQITVGASVDVTAPTVSSIAVSGSPAANASSVTYTVTFSENVSGVDAADFTLATTGTATGTIGTITQVSASVYTVLVTGISGAGTLGLNLNSSGTGIKDAANNAIAAGFTGTTRTVDRVAPTFDVAASASSVTSTGFSLSASLNEAGTIYYVLVANNAAAPTAAEVEAGTASGGGAALKFGSLSASSSPFDGSGSITGLTAGTAYDLYVVAKDSAGNLMGSPVKVDVLTTGGASNGAPTNSAVPTVSGTAMVGNALSGASGSWSDPDGDSLSYRYQWYRADDANGTNATLISGATSASYTLTTSDAHKYLRLAVIADDGNSNTTTAYSAYTAITNSVPVNSVIPSVSGTATVGNALSTTNGTWTDADGDGRSYSYQWYRADDTNGTNAALITGATSSSYTLTTSDAHKYLRVVVTANDGRGGTQSAVSIYTAIINSAPVNSAVPSVSGTATVGNALSTTNGTWTDADGDGRSYSYQWYRASDTNGSGLTAISGATSASYTLAAGDLNKYLRVVVTANDGRGGTQSATSIYSSLVGAAGNGAPTNSVIPTVSGTATVGNALSGASGTWSDPDGDSLSYRYQWYRADDSNGTNAALISGATSASYSLTTSDAHKYLRLAVIADDGNSNTTTAYSAYTAITNSVPVNSVIPSVSGTATVGNALSTTNGTWTDADGDGRSYSYQWYRADDTNGTNAALITGATSSSYTLTTSDAHKYLRVVVTANDGRGGTQSAVSIYTAIINSAPVNSAVPSVSGTATVGNALSTTNGTWTDADGDGRSYSYQWYRASDTNGSGLTAISGATSSSYTLTTSDAHKYLRVVVTANDGRGGTQSAVSTYTAITNSAPSLAAPSVINLTDTAAADSFTHQTGTLSASDVDGDSRTYGINGGATVSFTANGVTYDRSKAGTYGTLYVESATGKYVFVPADAAINALSSNTSETFTVTVSDGALSDSRSLTIAITGTNDAPVMSSDARSLTAISEDATGNGGDTVAAILASAGTGTDADGNSLGIAITAVDNRNGTWEYKSGAGSWTAITGVSGSAALLLANTDRVRFVPNADYNGSATGGITFKAWDQTSGTAGTTVGNDTTANGGLGNGGQYSAASATAGIAVTALNDAPVLSDTVLTLPAIAQNAGAPSGAAGVAVSSLVAIGTNVTDVDSGAVTGIALVGLDTSAGGTWYYSTDGGANWTAVGTVNDSGSALLLRTTDRLYYQPTGASAGILGAAITFRAWDQTSGTAGTKVATGGGGGTSAFSAATDTASLSITPVAPGAPGLAAASDTGNSSTDNITKATSVTFNGSGANVDANATVRLYANGTLLASATADAAGAYSFTNVDVSGLSGAVGFTVRQVIAGMESGDSASRTVTFDRTAPTVTIATVAGDNVLNAAESGAAQTVSGTATGAEDGQTVTVALNGKTYSATVSNNAWSLSIPSADLLALTDGGTFTITANLSDVAGNAATQATRSLSVDRTAPTVSIAAVAGDDVLNAAESGVAQTVSGVTSGVEDGQTVTVTLNGKTYSATVTNNAWSLTVSSADLLALTDGGSFIVTASLADAAGNAAQTTRGVSVDRTPPEVVSVTAPAAKTYLPGETISFYVQVSEPVLISGSGPVLTLNVGGTIRTATYNAAGSTGPLLRFDYVVPVGDRAPGGISVVGLALNGSSVTDAAQGPLLTALKGVGDTRGVVVDTPVPAKPGAAVLAGLSDSGDSATDGLTNVTRPTLTGTAEPNSTVTVLVDGKAAGTATADANGFWVHQLQTPLSDGAHSITTTATNRFGIVSEESSALSLVVDTAKPVTPAPSVTSATVAGTATGELISGNPKPAIGGTTEPGSRVSVLVDGKPVGSVIADANGAWSFQFATALADGNHSVQVQATDKAGNAGALSAATSLTIDTTPPSAPTVTLNSTGSGTPVVQGTAEPNSLVTVTINGQPVGTARASAAGTWQLALASDPGVGSYTITAKASDAAGNTGSAGTTTYTVAAPPPPVAVAPASTGNTTTFVSPSTTGPMAGTTGPALGTAPALSSVQMSSIQTSSDAGRVITSASIGNGGAAGNSSTDAGRSITVGNISNSTSSDAGRSITLSNIGGAPSGGGAASGGGMGNSSSAVLGGGTASNGGLGGNGSFSGGATGGQGTVGAVTGTGAGMGNGGLNASPNAPGSSTGSPTGPAPGNRTAPAGSGPATGGQSAGPGTPQGTPQGRPQGQEPSGDAPKGGEPGNTPAGAGEQGQPPGSSANLDGVPATSPAFSRQVAQVHGAADARTASLLAALIKHVPPGNRAA